MAAAVTVENDDVLDDVDASMLVLTAVADDDVLLLNTDVDGVGVEVLVILEVLDDVNTSVVAALVAEDDALLLEAAADADKGADVVVEDGATTTCCFTLALCSTSSAGRPTRLMPVLRFSGVISLDTDKPWLTF